MGVVRSLIQLTLIVISLKLNIVEEMAMVEKLAAQLTKNVYREVSLVITLGVEYREVDIVD